MFEAFLKYAFIAVTYPIWWPILKTMWAELQGALWREGGLIGREPTERELPALEEKYRDFLSPLINETFAEYQLREADEEAERHDRKARGGPPDPSGAGARRSDVVRPAQSSGQRRAAGAGTGARGFGSRPASGARVVRPRPGGGAGSAARGFASPAAGGAARPRRGF